MDGPTMRSDYQESFIKYMQIAQAAQGVNLHEHSVISTTTKQGQNGVGNIAEEVNNFDIE
jgi:hypothetical protein